MPVYEEKNKVNGQRRYFVRTYATDECGYKKQITKHNKLWVGREGYKLAQQEENRILNSVLISSVKNEKRNITISELKELYLSHIEPKVDIDTYKEKKNRLRHFCDIDVTKQVKTYPKLNIRKYSKDMYLIWQKEMKAKKYYKGKYEYDFSIKHLNRIHGEICLMMDFAIVEGYCDKNFARQCGRIGSAKEVKLSNKAQIYEVIDFGEFQHLMEVSVANKKYNAYFDLSFSRGPRPGEVRAFRACDHYYERKQLMVNHTMSKENVLKPPKTASSKAPIDLDDDLNEKIKSLIDDLKQQPGFNPQWYIFGGEKPISTHALTNARDKYFKEANISKHIRLHDFRHSCATWLFSVKIPITVISKVLRHANVNETMKTYTHLVNDEYLRNMEIINSLKSAV